MERRVVAILNTKSGLDRDKHREKAVEKAFERTGVSARIWCVSSGDELFAAVREASAESDILVAGGGDGTISAVASIAAQENKTLGVLPLGTLNHFSKDLGIPQDIHGAVEVVAAGHVREIDVAELNGRYFINNSSIGLYPHLVRTRERRQRLGYGKAWAALWALTRIVRRHPFQDVKIEFLGNEIRRETPFVFIGNNAYEMDLYNIGTRSSLHDGKLCVYLLRKGGRTGLGLLVFRTVFGGLKRSKYFESFTVTHLTIEMRKRSALVAMDGEVAYMAPPLEYKIHPGKLKVIVPDKLK